MKRLLLVVAGLMVVGLSCGAAGPSATSPATDSTVRLSTTLSVDRQQLNADRALLQEVLEEVLDVLGGSVVDRTVDDEAVPCAIDSFPPRDFSGSFVWLQRVVALDDAESSLKRLVLRLDELNSTYFQGAGEVLDNTSRAAPSVELRHANDHSIMVTYIEGAGLLAEFQGPCRPNL